MSIQSESVCGVFPRPQNLFAQVIWLSFFLKIETGGEVVRGVAIHWSYELLDKITVEITH